MGRSAEDGELWVADTFDAGQETWVSNHSFENWLPEERASDHEQVPWDQEARSDALENFLDQALQAGQRDSQGVFTLAREQARNKLARFQLHSPGHWAVKFVQFIVRTGSQSPMTFRSTGEFTELSFDLGPQFEVEQFESRFYGSLANPEPPWNYLLASLWSVGVGETRPFALHLTGYQIGWQWDGEQLHRRDASPSAELSSFRVSHLGKVARSPLRGKKLAKARKQELSRALMSRCFVCPLPLTVDGLRIDALQLCPHQGWRETQCPVKVGFLDLAELQAWTLPPGSFREEPSKPRQNVKLWGRTLGDEFWLLDTEPTRVEASLAYVLTWHTNLKGPKDISALKERPLTKRSSCFFVQDGSIIGGFELAMPETSCAFGLYLSAFGIKTDLTGLEIVDSEEAEKRAHAAIRLLLGSLKKPSQPEVGAPAVELASAGILKQAVVNLAQTLVINMSPLFVPLPLLMTMLTTGREELQHSLTDRILRDLELSFCEVDHHLSLRPERDILSYFPPDSALPPGLRDSQRWSGGDPLLYGKVELATMTTHAQPSRGESLAAHPKIVVRLKRAYSYAVKRSILNSWDGDPQLKNLDGVHWLARDDASKDMIYLEKDGLCIEVECSPKSSGTLALMWELIKLIKASIEESEQN